MFLSSLRVKNFRSCDETVVRFHEDLTILAGENNAGKTNVLDAIRILTSPSDGRRARFAEREDIRRGSGVTFEIEAEFGALSNEQRGAFISALKGPVESAAIYGLTYEATASTRRGALTRWVGPSRGSDPEPEARDLIRHVHLPALRDATRELASSSPGRIEFLLRHTASAEHQAGLLETARTSLKALAEHGVILAAETLIAESFRELTVGVQPHDAKLGFADPTLQALARDLRFRLALSGFDPTDLSETGLGYANLLFLSSVLVELRAARDAELTLFLVEEPEAHLHPQLQAVTLEYLRDQASQSRREERGPGERDGRIQVIVTTHSPNLTAGASISHVVVLRSVTPPVGQATEKDAAVTVSSRLPASRAIAIAKLKIADAVIQKIDRYLDVTRSALLFSRRILLVEGIAEALLVPVFARLLFKGNAVALARFRGATLVPIEGVDFEPYVRLLLTGDATHGATLADRVVIITDEDPGTSGTKRPERLSAVATELGAGTKLHVHQTPHTFEAALLESAGAEIMKLAFLDQHPRSDQKWRTEIDSAPVGQKGAALVKLMRTSETRKGDFAQSLAMSLATSSAEVVPETFKAALERLVATP